MDRDWSLIVYLLMWLAVTNLLALHAAAVFGSGWWVFPLVYLATAAPWAAERWWLVVGWAPYLLVCFARREDP